VKEFENRLILEEVETEKKYAILGHPVHAQGLLLITPNQPVSRISTKIKKKTVFNQSINPLAILPNRRYLDKQ